MVLIKKLLSAIRKNKDYLYGALFVALTTLLGAAFLVNNGINLQDGWYNIYARNIINGMTPYKDFFFLMPPLFLYLWTAIQYIFGDNFIVFHIAGLLLKLGAGLMLYHIMTKFFSFKISAVCATLAQIIFITLIYDNGMMSYNGLRVIFMYMMIILIIRQTDYIEKFAKTSNKLFIWLGVVFTLSFLTKQTDGPINIMAAVAVMLFIVWKHFGIKSIFKPFFIMFAASMVSLAILLLPLICKGALPYYISNIFGGVAAKGNIGDIFARPFEILLLFEFVWPVALAAIAVFCFWAVSYLRKINFTQESIPQNKNTGLFLLWGGAAFAGIYLAAYLTARISFYRHPERLIHETAHLRMNQIITILLYVLFFLCIYQIIKALLSKKLLSANAKMLAVGLLFISSAYVHMMSWAYPIGFFYIAGFAAAFLLAFNIYGKFLKNSIIYTLMSVIIFFGLLMKLQTPCLFHGWVNLSVINGDYSYSHIPKLKGIRISAQEKEMYEEIYKQTNIYTTKDDKILAFNNNQVFYDLLERQPYNQYITLYHDVAPDSQALETLEQLKTDLPKEIVFLKFSEQSETLHEGLFRNKKPSGQRALKNYITDLIAQNKYTVALSYQKEFYTDKNKIEEQHPNIFQRLEELEKQQASLNNANSAISANSFGGGGDTTTRREKRNLERIIRRGGKWKNAFVEHEFELMLLIRTDVYNEILKKSDEGQKTVKKATAKP